MNLLGAKYFFFLRRPNGLWGPPSILLNEYRMFFPGGKAAGACSWPLTSN
jgi:hypothetical protein